MSRFKKLKDWPDKLKTMTVIDLQRERSYWQTRIRYLGHPQAKKTAFNRFREIEAELAARDQNE